MANNDPLIAEFAARVRQLEADGKTLEEIKKELLIGKHADYVDHVREAEKKLSTNWKKDQYNWHHAAVRRHMLHVGSRGGDRRSAEFRQKRAVARCVKNVLNKIPPDTTDDVVKPRCYCIRVAPCWQQLVMEDVTKHYVFRSHVIICSPLVDILSSSIFPVIMMTM